MKNGKTRLRLLAVVLCLCMVLSMTPMGTLAADATTQLPLNQIEMDLSADTLTLSEAQMEEAAENQWDGLEGNVRVVIFMESGSLTDSGFSTLALAQNADAMAMREKLLSEQDAVARRIEKQILGEALETHYQFTIGVNAIAATVPAETIGRIEKIRGVKEVLLDTYYEALVTEPNTATSGEMVNFYSAWADGYTGAGSIVAIIDTGIDRDHDSFTEEGFYYGLATSAAQQGKSVADYDLLTVEEINELLPKLHVYEQMENEVTAEDLYTNDKIPFGFNYLFSSAEYNCDATSGDHGCHVAGIAAANTYVPTSDEDGDIYYAKQAQGVTGVAPNAQILVMKVFSDGWGAYETNYMAAIEDAIILGADAVNLSLGSVSAGRTFNASYGKLLESLLESDTVMTNSAGNNGGWADNEIGGVGLNRTEDVRTNSGGSPGSYNESFTVASADNIAITGVVGDYNGYLATVNDTGENYGAYLFPTLDTSADATGTDYPYVFLGNPQTGEGIYGLEEDFENVDLSGKIVLISRGNSSFFEKANLAVEHGAVATVIYNNVDGSINMNLTGYLYTNPAVSMAKADSDAILAVSTQDAETGLWGGTVTISATAQTVYNGTPMNISSFSSWGCGDNLNLKPEITSPGGNIYSTLDGNTYGLNSGTSMSAPSAAGSAAVVSQYIRENDLVEKTGLSVRELTIALMMSTARPITDAATGLPYSPRVQGSGLTDVYGAVTTPAYLLVGEKEGNDGKVKLELGDDPSRTGIFVGQFSVNNITGEDLTYSFDSNIFTTAVETYDGVDYMSKSGYSLMPQVEFSTEAEYTYVYDLSGDAVVDSNDAMILLRVANGTAPALSEEDANLCDFDCDGAITTTDAQILLSATRGDTAYLDASAKTYVVPAEESVTVNFVITLSDADREYIEAYYPNGAYIDGFLYVNSESGDDRQLSVPLLAFYGNWSDASMYEHWTLLEDAYNDEAVSYLSNSTAMNYLSVKYRGSNSETALYANNWANDDEYIADRNAINNRATLYRAFPTFLRNAANVSVIIRDAKTGEEYFTKSTGMGTGAYYYTSGGYWSGLSSSQNIDWRVTNAEGDRLPEGTTVEIVVRAVTEYNWDRENSAVVGTLGEGAYWVTTMTVDNTAPEATSLETRSDSVTGERSLTVKAVDNRYTAAVLLLSADGSTVYARSAVNQTEPGVEATAEFDLSGIYTGSFVVALFDYAGNYTMYSVEMGGDIPAPDTNTVLSVALPDDNGQWFADLDVDEQTLTTKNTTAGEIPVLSMARGKDGALYAASQESVDGYLVSSLYTVNEADYAMTKIGGPAELGYTDMAYAPTVNGGTMLAVYGNYAVVVDTATGNYLGAWDLTSYIGSSTYAVGLAFVQTTATSETGVVDIFMLLDSKGVLYQTGFSYNSSTSQYVIYKPTAMTQIPNMYSGTFYGSSMYCERGQLFISALSVSGNALYSHLMSADLTGETIWLFDRGAVNTAPMSIYDATAKETAGGDSAINALVPLGEAVAAQSGDIVQRCPATPIHQ